MRACLADGIVRRAGVTPGVDAELAGMLALSMSLTAAADRRPTDVGATLDYAAELAERTGEGNRFSLSFGPTNVTLWRTTAALEANDYERTVALAETVIPERIRASSRRAGYWMNYGRALARVHRREDAVLALRRAEQISPDEVPRNPFVREVLGELLAPAGTRPAGSCGGWPTGPVCRCSCPSGGPFQRCNTSLCRSFTVDNRDRRFDNSADRWRQSQGAPRSKPDAAPH